MLYLRAELFSHQLQFFVKLRVKELHLFYIFLTTTITHCNFSGVYAGCIILLQCDHMLQQRVDITEKLSESEKLMKEMSQTWEEKLQKTGELYDMVEA
jgi:hypothetical protein